MKFLETVKHALDSMISVWRTWDLHGFVLASLLLQIFLFVAALFRKRTSNGVLVVLIWLAYQLVDMVKSRSLITFTSNKNHTIDSPYLYTLWAVFLIMHFGGPDTITALSVEDNDLWQRSWLEINTQLIATVNVALGVPRKRKFYLWPLSFSAATLSIFVVGLVKVVERVFCLKEASLEVFEKSLVPMKPNPGPDYAAMVKEHHFYEEHGLPLKFDDILQEAAAAANSTTCDSQGMVDLNDIQVVKQAYYFYNKFRGMYIDMVFCCHDRKESRDIFLKFSPQSAFRVIETEMKFAYEAFYTKTHLLSDSLWKVIRQVCLLFELFAGLMMFLWSSKGHHEFQSMELFVTVSLISWAVVADIFGFIILHCSDWKIALSTKKASPPQVPRPMEQGSTLSHKPKNIFHRQWSESISQFNFINYSVRQRCDGLEKVVTLIGATSMADSLMYVSKKWLTGDIKGFIFQKLKEKSSIAENLDAWEDVSSSRGSWTLRNHASSDLDPATFHPWVMNVEYDESLLIWHIATELCYETEPEPEPHLNDEHRKFSKVLSDYMAYLFFKQNELMSGIAPMAQIIFTDTSQEARRFFHKCTKMSHKQACERIMQVRTDLVSPIEVKGEESMSVLFDACQLAKHLIHVKNKGVNHWELISHMWVEFLCYTATQTAGSHHATLLCQGGELVTFVRLLTFHVGLTDKFRKAKYTRRSEIVLDA